MNPETLNLIERSFPDVVDDILTAVVGGKVNEPIIFDVKSDSYALAEPASGLRGITGTLEKRPHSFQNGVDFLFSEGDNAVVWQEGGDAPDDESIFFVDYFRRDSSSPLTDINVGSVTRTLSEAIGREIATVYQQINLAYLSAFIDTAEGTSLDLVVAILGIERHTAEFAQGLVTLFRDPQVRGNVTVPEGALLSTEKGDAVFRTIQLRTLQAGQARIDVPIRATEDFKGEDGVVAAASIVEMNEPIAGVARITNFEPTFLGSEGETDEQLRARAKAALRALGKATWAALAKAVFEARAEILEAYDPNSPPAQRTPPGTAAMLVDAEPERFAGVKSAVEETRAAGVRTTIVARYVFVRPKMGITVPSSLTPAGKLKVIDEIIAALQAYANGLDSGQPALGEEMLAAASAVDDVSEAGIVDVIVERADVLRPSAEDLLETLVAAASEAGAEDEEGLRRALGEALDRADPTVPSGRRIPDPTLLQDLSGAQANLEDIQAGEFQVSATVEGEAWQIVIDMGPDDILLQQI